MRHVADPLVEADTAEDIPVKSQVSRRLIRRAKPGVTRLIGESPDTETIRQFIKRMARKDAPVLITGQTGTGKEVAARAIHEESTRANQPFMAINCAALSESLLTSELFGHKRGAFTGAAERHPGLIRATGRGTLFLDEIGEMSPGMQASFLRILEEGEYRAVGSTEILTMQCRILAATNRNLTEEVKTGRFRDDLLYRLRRIELHLSPLHIRREDILPLAHYFFNWDRTADERVRLTPRLENLLKENDWPGNVRELRNTIESIRLFHGDKTEYDISDLLDVKLNWQQTRLADEPGASEPAPVGQSGFAPPPAGPDQASNRSLLRRERAALALFEQHGCLTRKELSQALGVSAKTASGYLKRLVDAGHIEKITPSRSSRSNYYQHIK